MYDPDAYANAQQAHTDAIQGVGLAYAAAFTKLDGSAWRYEDSRPGMESHDRRTAWRFNLVHVDTGRKVSVDVSPEHDKRATCSPRLPGLPDGTGGTKYSIWRDFGFRAGDTYESPKIEQPTAGVSYERFLTNVPACAKRFYTLVAMPYAAVWDQVLARQARHAGQYADRDAAAAKLAETFGGTVSQHHNSRDVVTVRIPNGPYVEVSAGGTFRMHHPSFNERQLYAYIRATVEKES